MNKCVRYFPRLSIYLRKSQPLSLTLLLGLLTSTVIGKTPPERHYYFDLTGDGHRSDIETRHHRGTTVKSPEIHRGSLDT